MLNIIVTLLQRISCGIVNKHYHHDGISRFSPIPISALSGTGTGELLDLVCSGLNKLEVCINIFFFQKTLAQEI